MNGNVGCSRRKCMTDGRENESTPVLSLQTSTAKSRDLKWIRLVPRSIFPWTCSFPTEVKFTAYGVFAAIPFGFSAALANIFLCPNLRDMMAERREDLRGEPVALFGL